MRIFGAPLARRIIFAVMIPALLISYVISSLFYMGSWQGFGALAHFNLFVALIATASFMAYALGQILDVHVFNRLRQSRHWWLAPTASTLFGNVSDTLAFFFIAFWRSPDAFMAEHWMEIALVDYCFKVLISIVFFLPMYGVLLNMLDVYKRQLLGDALTLLPRQRLMYAIGAFFLSHLLYTIYFASQMTLSFFWPCLLYTSRCV